MATLTNTGRRAFAAAGLLALAGFAASAANAWPTQPIKIIVGFAAGGPTDVIARLVAQELSGALGQTVIVENRAGGTASVATEAVASAPPDGHTLLFSSVQLLINPILSPGKHSDPFKAFAPISNVALLPMVVITAADSPLTSIDDIVKTAKSRPGSVFFGSSGNGSAPHLAAATLQMLTGASMTNVPFRGNGPALTEVIGGRVNFMFYPSVGIAQHVETKRLKVLAVGTESPNPQFPGAPTFRQAGYPDLVLTAPWVGMLAPAGTPAAVIDRLSTEVRTALAKPQVREKMAGFGADIVGSTPQQYAEFLRKDHEHWSRVVQAAGVKAE